MDGYHMVSGDCRRCGRRLEVFDAGFLLDGSWAFTCALAVPEVT